MCACIDHDKYKFLVVLLPDEEPVGLDVTLPLPLSVAIQHMRKVLGRQFALGGENADGLCAAAPCRSRDARKASSGV